MSRPIRVVLVDGPAPDRARLRAVVEAEADMIVVEEAATAQAAPSAVAAGRAEVVVVDLEVPGGGRAAIEGILRNGPRPILLLGRVSGSGPTATVEARAAGASDVLPRPEVWDEISERALRRRVRALVGTARWQPQVARSGSEGDGPAGLAAVPGDRPAPPARPRPAPALTPRPDVPLGEPVVAIGASTGGPTAVAAVLQDVPRTVPVLLVQHIGAALVDGLVDWLARTSGWPVSVANDGEVVSPGRVLVGPAGRHLTVDGGMRVRLADAGADLHQPSADRLFRSLAASVGPRTIAALLTGMGSDGADGLLAVRQAGGVTFAQDEASSAVFGMAKAAIERGAAEKVAPLDAIGGLIAQAVRRQRPA